MDAQSTEAAGVSSGSPVPDYRELPRDQFGAKSSWGLFGSDDSLGLMNLLTAEGVVAAARLVVSGAVFPLDVRTGYVNPPFFDRGVPRHTLIERRPGRTVDDVFDNVFPQAGSQWDSLGHVAARPGQFYNGATREQVTAGERNTIDNWARHGIVTRAVVLDVAAQVAERGGPGTSVAITVDDLEAARQQAGVDYRAGDVLLLHTGFLAWYGEQDQPTRLRLSRRETLTAAGLEHSEAMAEYIWDSHAVAVASDTAGLEVWPTGSSDDPFGSMHRIFIGLFGLAIGELWWLADLARDCRLDGRYEALLTSAPWNAAGAIGSPPNAIAVK